MNARSEHREDLRCFLLQQPSGPIQDTSKLSRLLAAVWASFDGSSAHQTTADKLHRVESCQWTPPRTLRFVLERHGGTVNDSTRAALHHWEIDLEAWTARIVKEGHRQLRPQSKRLDVQPLADQVAEAILNQAEHPWIARKPDGSVRVSIGAIIPEGDEQTTVGL